MVAIVQGCLRLGIVDPRAGANSKPQAKKGDKKW